MSARAKLTAPVIETERLILRAPGPEDYDAWAAFSADETAMLYLGGHQTRIGAWRILSVITGAWVINGFSMFSVIEKASGRWVGRLGPWRPEGWPGDEVGWGIAREHWGKGYAVEGATAAIDWAFNTLGWTEVVHCIDPNNKNSQRVAQKLGSRPRGKCRLPPPFDALELDLWGQTADEWRARKG